MPAQIGQDLVEELGPGGQGQVSAGAVREVSGGCSLPGPEGDPDQLTRDHCNLTDICTKGL